jgi:hypothetical protein
LSIKRGITQFINNPINGYYANGVVKVGDNIIIWWERTSNGMLNAIDDLFIDQVKLEWFYNEKTRLEHDNFGYSVNKLDDEKDCQEFVPNTQNKPKDSYRVFIISA